MIDDEVAGRPSHRIKVVVSAERENPLDLCSREQPEVPPRIVADPAVDRLEEPESAPFVGAGAKPDTGSIWMRRRDSLRDPFVDPARRGIDKP